MRSISAILLFTLFLLFTVGCGGNGIRFTTIPAETVSDGVNISASLRIIPEEGSLELTYSVNNKSDAPIAVNDFQAELRTAAGLMNLPRSGGRNKTLQPGDSTEGKLVYTPINSAWLYQRIGLKGPLRKEYILNLGFLRKQGKPLTGSVRFRMEDEKYNRYAAETGGEIRLYKPDFDPAVFKSAHEAYYKKLGKELAQGHGHKHEHHQQAPATSMIVSGAEVMLPQMILKMVPYTRGENLYLYMKLINRGDPLTLDTGKIILSTAGKKFSAAGGSKKGIRIRLDRNGRLINHFKVGRCKGGKTLRVTLSGILGKNKKPFFIRDFVYTRDPGR